MISMPEVIISIPEMMIPIPEVMVSIPEMMIPIPEVRTSDVGSDGNDDGGHFKSKFSSILANNWTVCREEKSRPTTSNIRKVVVGHLLNITTFQLLQSVKDRVLWLSMVANVLKR
ncbi:hypothetical protein HELRODRAFT_179770 [Helobdella robusta]|uniref:Uncharacterized protein n=1 Tax=Helobdella robusta TaxID=6412 RepID=T1FF48_HELRO|nr:hypothetical protein HELRODRAFT_179770 [Helobdella robusta]ESN95172.1 hypothetical protein HELRODRAFT_179770 [Helobdella robusta]